MVRTTVRTFHAGAYAAGLTLGLTLTAAVAVSQPTYTVVDLGYAAHPTAIDQDGTVVGTRPVDGDTQATRWSPRGMPTTLRPLPGALTAQATSVQGRWTCGASLTAPEGGSWHAVLWRDTGAPQDLHPPTLDPTLSSWCTGVAGPDLQVGYADDPAHPHLGFFLPVLWVKGIMQYVPTLGGTYGLLRGVNAKGHAVGGAALADRWFHAILVVHGLPVDLDPGPGGSSQAWAINAHEVVIGYTSRGGDTGFRWSPTDGLTALLPRPGDTYSQAWGLNDVRAEADDRRRPGRAGRSEQIVGHSCLVLGYAREVCTAMLWQDEDALDLTTRLLTPGWALQRANAVNDAGRIVGLGQLTGEPHGVLLVPTGPLAGR